MRIVFARFHLATRKLPFQRQVHGAAALANQYLAVLDDDGTGNDEHSDNKNWLKILFPIFTGPLIKRQTIEQFAVMVLFLTFTLQLFSFFVNEFHKILFCPGDLISGFFFVPGVFSLSFF